MRNLLVLLSLTLALTATPRTIFAQHNPPSADAAPAALFSGMGSLHHAIATSNPEAQRFFDQGLTLVYAFNHDEAGRSFRRAAELDPKAAMPWWGIALALGPNYNDPSDPEREKAAFDAIEKAKSLAASGPESERAYIAALSTRYSGDPNADFKALAHEYSRAMGALAKNYPDDPDAATIYAESMMDLRPWGLWALDGTPAEGTLEIIAVLESVLARFPNHVGANHYYIHAVEASPHAAWGLESADRLNTLVPNAGHLVHMPSHIYSRVGDFPAAIKSNAAAAEADQNYITASGATGMYPAMYYSHNLHFLAYAAMQAGESEKARKAAETLAENIRTRAAGMPPGMTEGFLTYPLAVRLRFREWQERAGDSGAGFDLDGERRFPAFRARLGVCFHRQARGCRRRAKGLRSERESNSQRAGIRIRKGGHNPADRVCDPRREDRRSARRFGGRDCRVDEGSRAAGYPCVRRAPRLVFLRARNSRWRAASRRQTSRGRTSVSRRFGSQSAEWAVAVWVVAKPRGAT